MGQGLLIRSCRWHLPAWQPVSHTPEAFRFATAQKTRGGGGQNPLSTRLFYDNSRPEPA